MYCPKCGYPLHSGALICIRCGEPVDESASKALENAQAAAEDVIHRFDPAEYAREVVDDDAWQPHDKPKLVLTDTPLPGMGAAAAAAAAQEPEAEPEAEEAPYEAPEPEANYPAAAPAESYYRDEEPLVPSDTGADGGALGMGIAAVALASSFYFSFLGIIFGIIGLSKSNKILAREGRLSPKARVGRILSTVGLWLGVGLTILLTIYVLVAVAAVLS